MVGDYISTTEVRRKAIPIFSAATAKSASGVFSQSALHRYLSTAQPHPTTSPTFAKTKSPCHKPTFVIKSPSKMLFLVDLLEAPLLYRLVCLLSSL
jgi:hypothetical protein